ncbi:MAG TPA: tRNA pseudouridine(55) synthase TruB [Burkholderiaceae bacterium]|nr:tRNA pseudouridine(55) synthase TruB [Burkholderiaceae bacterium]
MRRAAADLIDGVLLLDKPVGVSSNLALQKARRLLQARKAGHTGTLDPLASGLLPLTFGEATKFSADLLDADKEYQARIELGVATSTGDAEGEIVARRAVRVTREQFETVLGRFVGKRQQVPPMHSALKRGGRPLYELARVGLEIERAARPIELTRLTLTCWDERRPCFELACSKGTYVRVLAQDIGEALGCGAHLVGLRRTRVGNLHLAQATTLAQLEEQSLSERRSQLLPVDALLANLPRISLDADEAARLGCGQRVRQQARAISDAPRLRVYDAHNRLVGLASCHDGWLRATRLVANIAPIRDSLDQFAKGKEIKETT